MCSVRNGSKVRQILLKAHYTSAVNRGKVKRRYPEYVASWGIFSGETVDCNSKHIFIRSELISNIVAIRFFSESIEIRTN
jgi:hypothetical protein